MENGGINKVSSKREKVIIDTDPGIGIFPFFNFIFSYSIWLALILNGNFENSTVLSQLAYSWTMTYIHRIF
jgi:hypothetical protein